MMSVLPPPLGRDSPMSIERIAPANQFHSQNTNTPLQSARNDRSSVATDGGGDGNGDGDVEMRPLDDRHPPSSACTLFLALSLFLFRFGYPILMCSTGRTGEGCVYTYGTSAQVH